MPIALRDLSILIEQNNPIQALENVYLALKRRRRREGKNLWRKRMETKKKQRAQIKFFRREEKKVV